MRHVEQDMRPQILESIDTGRVSTALDYETYYMRRMLVFEFDAHLGEFRNPERKQVWLSLFDLIGAINPSLTDKAANDVTTTDLLARRAVIRSFVREVAKNPTQYGVEFSMYPGYEERYINDYALAALPIVFQDQTKARKLVENTFTTAEQNGFNFSQLDLYKR